jgi:hypothetical protein
MQSAPLYAHAAKRVCVGGETCGCIQGEINALSNPPRCTAVNYCAKLNSAVHYKQNRSGRVRGRVQAYIVTFNCFVYILDKPDGIFIYR